MASMASSGNLKAALAVFWSFFGVRKRRDYDADAGSLSFGFASSWLPEGFDDGDGTNNQTARIRAFYAGKRGFHPENQGPVALHDESAAMC